MAGGRALLAALGCLVLSQCGRTGLDPWGLPAESSQGGRPSTSALPASAGAFWAAGVAGAEPEAGASSLPPERAGGSCVSSAEVCNGRDDDCDGVVDDVPPEVCPDGGARYCVAGRMSDCPRRCSACVPGSVRICQNAYCTFWGESECSADGQGFGPCRERRVPAECDAIASKHQDSRELEQCCLDNGYCCLDRYDLDHDGARDDVVGNCASVTCD